MSASLPLLDVGIVHPRGRGFLARFRRCGKQMMALLQQHDANERLLITVFLLHGFLFGLFDDNFLSAHDVDAGLRITSDAATL